MTATRDEPTVAYDDPLPSPSASVAGKHVVVVGINYWPEPTGIAPYTTGVAEHLVKSAASVRVIAGLPCYPSWSVSDGYGALRSREWRNGVEITRLRHYVPASQNALRRGTYEASFYLHARSLPVAGPVDLVIAVTPAPAGAAVAVTLARRFRVPLAVIVQDLMGLAATQSGMAGGGRVSALAGRVEAAVLRRADRVAVVSESFRSSVLGHGVVPERLTVLPNWSHVQPASSTRAETRRSLGWAPDVVVALHTGNMGLKQDLHNIVSAARSSQDQIDLRWVLMGDGSQRPELEAATNGLANITLLEPCRATDYPNILAASDVLLLNERPSVADMSLPSKLTSYLTAGRPIVAAVAPNGATHAELIRSGAAAIVDAGSPEALVRAVRRVAGDPQLAQSLVAAAKEYQAAHLGVVAAMARLDDLLASCWESRG